MTKTKNIIDQRGQHISFQRALNDFYKGTLDFRGYTNLTGFFYPLILFVGLCFLFVGLFFFLLNLIGFVPTAMIISRLFSRFGPLEFLIIVVTLVSCVSGLFSFIRRWRDIGLTFRFFFLLWSVGILGTIFIPSAFNIHMLLSAALVIACLPSGSCLTEKPNHFFCRNKHQEPPYTYEETTD